MTRRRRRRYGTTGATSHRLAARSRHGLLQAGVSALLLVMLIVFWDDLSGGAVGCFTVMSQGAADPAGALEGPADPAPGGATESMAPGEPREQDERSDEGASGSNAVRIEVRKAPSGAPDLAGDSSGPPDASEANDAEAGPPPADGTGAGDDDS